MKRAMPSRQSGLTLIELTTATAVLALALRMAIPAMQDILQSVGLQSASSDLLSDLYLARSEALKRNRHVALCKSADGVKCAATGGWEQGWFVFHDENNNGVADAGEEILARHGPLPLHLRLSGNQPVAKYISFASIGVTKLTGGGFQAGTLTLCQLSAKPTPSRQVVLNAGGRPRVQKTTLANCI
jgi:type IV fimbrial biogenesis protein FimT